ncbi:glycoside hydrolase domain-containing protein [Caulobacter segnis]
MRLGYVLIDKEPEAASKTVEYAYDDWTIAKVAADLGQAEVAKTSRDTRRLVAQQLRPEDRLPAGPQERRGPIASSFDPTAINYGSDYTEGNARQYSWFAPQDLGGVVKALGGDAATVKKLDAMFDFDNSKVDYSHAEDIAGLIGQYIHGNEPSHHVAYLYDYAGAPVAHPGPADPDREEASTSRPPDGLSGNDDLGQMSAWLMFTSLGFCPVTPASNRIPPSAGRSWKRRR